MVMKYFLTACISLQLTFLCTPLTLSSPFHWTFSQRSLIISSYIMALLQWTLSRLPHLEGLSSFAILSLCFVNFLPPFCTICFFCFPSEFTPIYHSPYSLQVILMMVRNHWWWTRDIQVMHALALQKKYNNGVFKGVGSGTKVPGLKSTLCYLLVAWPWQITSISLYLSVSICKARIRIVFTLQSCCED